MGASSSSGLASPRERSPHAARSAVLHPPPKQHQYPDSSPSAIRSGGGGQPILYDQSYVQSAVESKALKAIICQLHPRLWLGSRDAASQLGLLRSLGITACINCTEEAHLHPKHLAYFHVPVADAPSSDILGSFDNWLLPWLERRLADPNSGAVLVYCQRGISRSCTIALCLLLHLQPQRPLLALWHDVKRARPQVRPNSGFLDLIVAYERKVRGEASVRVSKKRQGFVAVANGPTEPLRSSRRI